MLRSSKQPCAETRRFVCGIRRKAHCEARRTETAGRRPCTQRQVLARDHAAPESGFAQRLRETRDARNLTQVELAALMRAKGHKISATKLVRLEGCHVGLSLDVAFALTEALEAVPVYMLTPPEEEMFIRLSGSVATDGAGMSEWLSSGLSDRTLPERRQNPPAELADEVERQRQSRANDARLRRLAQGFVDAWRLPGQDGEAATTRAANALRNEVLRQESERESQVDA